jgi:hypothetical protein
MVNEFREKERGSVQCNPSLSHSPNSGAVPVGQPLRTAELRVRKDLPTPLRLRRSHLQQSVRVRVPGKIS